ncbi:conserved hypothetical protein [Sporisorium reilianum SRZ2]|uniref:Uncharacterized protein n=1 Tax=Sporisorium reilianum (strain SRZ2) TaxID=999809 RepID=E6ZNP9_SPORE|nr:conserved hypothetical protein [Sporisorium reilianum SRZ2]
MIQKHPDADDLDPFNVGSSSPEKPPPPSYVATRPNPYTIKSQNTQYQASLRTTAEPFVKPFVEAFAIDPRLFTPTVPSVSDLSKHKPTDRVYSSSEAADSTPPCPSKSPRSTPAPKHPKPTMVKSKSRPVPSLTSSVELPTATKRQSCVETASQAANKRQRNVAQAATHPSRVMLPSHGVPTRSRSLPYPNSSARFPLFPISLEYVPRSRVAPQKRRKLVIPKITLRAPTPEPPPPPEQLLPKKDTDAKIKDMSEPVYVNGLLFGLTADMSKVEDGIDDILSKYFDTRKPTGAVGIELLRTIASSMSRLYCAVKKPGSQLGLLKLRAISSHMFKHTVTGFFHLLQDPLAPFAAASCLALVSAKLLQDFDKATDWCCRIFAGPTQAQQNLRHGDLFLNVLLAELDLIFDRGVALTDQQSRLTVPGKGCAFSKWLHAMEMDDDELMSARPGSSAWLRRLELRKQYAQEGDQRDEFVNLAVIRFIGQLVIHHVISLQVLAKWLDRFLVNTVYLGIPSVWEIECGCALLITVGATLDRQPEARHAVVAAAAMDTSSFSSTADEGEQASSESDAGDRAGDSQGFELLNKVMDRVDHLIAEDNISQQARGWLIEVRNLRERGWTSRADGGDSTDESYSSS